MILYWYCHAWHFMYHIWWLNCLTRSCYKSHQITIQVAFVTMLKQYKWTSTWNFLHDYCQNLTQVFHVRPNSAYLGLSRTKVCGESSGLLTQETKIPSNLINLTRCFTDVPHLIEIQNIMITNVARCTRNKSLIYGVRSSLLLLNKNKIYLLLRN